MCVLGRRGGQGNDDDDDNYDDNDYYVDYDFSIKFTTALSTGVPFLMDWKTLLGHAN